MFSGRNDSRLCRALTGFPGQELGLWKVERRPHAKAAKDAKAAKKTSFGGLCVLGDLGVRSSSNFAMISLLKVAKR
jgi:hypothetical protein